MLPRPTDGSVEQFPRNVAAVVGDLRQHRLVQPTTVRLRIEEIQLVIETEVMREVG